MFVLCHFPAIGSAPENFTAEALGTAVTFTWISPDVDEVIVSFRLICNSDEVVIEIKDINTITLYDLMPETTYYCTLAASSSGGYGPSTEMINVTTGGAGQTKNAHVPIHRPIHYCFSLQMPLKLIRIFYSFQWTSI